MDTPQTKFQTSFVPKKPVIASQSTQFKKKSNLFFILTLILFIATVCFAGGVYAYKITLNKQIENQKSNLIKANDRFDKGEVSRATRLNDRIIAVKAILDNHVSPSVIFDIFEKETLETVRFKTLSFITEPQKKILVNATGVGADFESIVLQSDGFGETGILKDVVFSSVQAADDRTVNFSFQTRLDKQNLLYSKTLNNTLDNKKTPTPTPSANRNQNNLNIQTPTTTRATSTPVVPPPAPTTNTNQTPPATQNTPPLQENTTNDSII